MCSSVCQAYQCSEDTQSVLHFTYEEIQQSIEHLQISMALRNAE